ncbi:MAG TPA: anti-sigma factor [Thermoanaerobaculia bacterium]|nr:anti-sigma factor [Thermoanaerobaculia bacterium]
MNDDDRNDGFGEDPSAERVLTALEERRLCERPTGTPAPIASDEAGQDELLERLYTEVLGLVAYELPQRPSRPAARERLLAAVRQRKTAAGAAGEPAADRTGAQPGPRVAPFPVPPAAAPATAAPVTAAAPRGHGDSAAMPGAASRSAAPPVRASMPAWMLTMAATLLLAVLALGAFSGWLYARIGHQEELLATLQHDLLQAERRADVLAAAQGDVERRRLDLASQLALITTPGVEVCPLHPVGDAPPFPEARGLLFLSNAREEWYVRLSGLGPAPPGRVYRLWFLMGDDRPVDAGLLRPGADQAIALAGTEMPDPGRMSGALVTLEPEGETPAERPVGPQVLFGDEKMMMI